MVTLLPPKNYTRLTMNVIDHIFICILPQSTNALIRQHFSYFVINQQRDHDRRSPRSRTTSHIISVYLEHAKETPDLLAALNYLRPAQNMKLYHLIIKAWNKVYVALLQRSRNVQTIVKALVYNRCIVLEPCVPTLVQTFMHAHLIDPPTKPPINTHIYTIPQRRIPYQHNRWNLSESLKLNR